MNVNPYRRLDADRSLFEHGRWPCRWISLPGQPTVAAYRRRIVSPTPFRAYVTADERFTLYCDGREIARGPERGEPAHWFYDTVEIPAGEHLLVAQVWSLGVHAARSQMSVRHGFLFSPEEDEHIARAGTGCAEWEAKALAGFAFERPFAHDFYSRASDVTLDGRVFPWGFENGEGDGWQPAEALHPGATAGVSNRYGPVHQLAPGTLPPMRREPFTGKVRRGGAHWERLLRGEGEWTAPAGATEEALIDFDEYRCGHARVSVSGGRGARVRIEWAEALYEQPEALTKGNRDEIEGKYFVGVGDTLLAPGGPRRDWAGPGLQAGRYLRVTVTTADEPLTLHALTFEESRYPLEMEAALVPPDPAWAPVVRLSVRSLQMCCHDAYIDGPFYEGMTWNGDSRLKALVNYVISSDDRLARKALTTFDRSRLPGGLTRARWPARDTMIIAPYSLLWVGMVHDFAWWRGDAPFVRGLLPGVRGVLDAFAGDGLIAAPAGWNFIDWAPGWMSGVPPGEPSGPLNWLHILTLEEAARVEDWLGEPLLAARLRQRAARLAKLAASVFWSEARGLFADDPEHRHFSEHTQSLAVLSGQAGSLDRMADVTPASIYFSHYAIEALAKLGRGEQLTSRLQEWRQYAQLGLKTLPEAPEPARSDCHGWGAHALYHLFASVMGVRPGSFGFETVRVRPLAPGYAGRVVHPRGFVTVAADGSVTAPEGVVCE